MKERPILFSAPMVRALLDGSKTQTRRGVNPQPPDDVVRILVDSFAPITTDRRGDVQPGPDVFGAFDATGSWGLRCPYGQPGDRLWVREAWRAPSEFNSVKPSDLRAPADGVLGTPIVYEASRHESVQFGKLRPSMFMPRWASRIALEVTDVRVERLQQIGALDAIAEGGEPVPPDPACTQVCPEDYVAGYRALWEQINGAGAWAANPWVWAIGFRRI